MVRLSKHRKQRFSSGQKVKMLIPTENSKWKDIDFGQVINENDIAGYYNDYPGKNWELVYFDNGEVSWVQRKNIRRT